MRLKKLLPILILTATCSTPCFAAPYGVPATLGISDYQITARGAQIAAVAACLPIAFAVFCGWKFFAKTTTKGGAITATHTF